MRKATTVALLLLLALAVPPPVSAAPIAAPPGNSEADQYFETVPAPGGGQSPDYTKSGQDAVADGNLTRSTVQALNEQGPAGRAVTRIAAQTAPPQAGGSRSTPSATEHAGGSAGFEVSDEQGMGLAFPLILVASAAVAAAFAIGRRHRSTAK